MEFSCSLVLKMQSCTMLYCSEKEAMFLLSSRRCINWEWIFFYLTQAYCSKCLKIEGFCSMDCQYYASSLGPICESLKVHEAIVKYCSGICKYIAYVIRCMCPSGRILEARGWRLTSTGERLEIIFFCMPILCVFIRGCTYMPKNTGRYCGVLK